MVTPDELVLVLRRAGCVFAEQEAELLLAATASADERARLVARRVAGEPLEYVLGWAEFCGLRLRVARGVFVPRRRTSLVVDLAAPTLAAGDLVVDLCCGVGAIGAALAARVSGIEVHAADVDPAAVECARVNLAGCDGRAYVGDLFDALPPSLRGRVDVLAVNAPYVPRARIALMPREAREYESPVALDGGADGLDLHRRIATGAPGWMRPGGRVFIETSVGQAERTAALLAAQGLRPRVTHRDDDEATVVRGTAP